jgi:two-component system sensor histidine kinase KdpD
MSAAERLELLSSIEDETARLSRFVSNLLDMSRIEAGNLKVKRDLVDVADVVQGAVERSRKAFPNQSVRVSLAPDLPYVRGDDRLLEQVLFNLLDNAHRYSGDSGATVHGRKEDGEVVLSVTDEGPGVKAADLERIFEKFYRGGRADGRKPGTGLGLSICRGLVEAMGGTIIAQSPAVRRRGTRIVIRLAAAEPPRIESKLAT